MKLVLILTFALAAGGSAGLVAKAAITAAGESFSQSIDQARAAQG